MSHKTVTSKRAAFTKAEREYVKGMVHNLSFKTLSDREITQWLHDENQMDLDMLKELTGLVSDEY